ncbi:MAG: hypothetical protein NWE83_04455 [Candidatus Bathyarchaeota archaeon]|nr:hypothetical protein [Candidatus Bathyarchaeota archaeon]
MGRLLQPKQIEDNRISRMVVENFTADGTSDLVTTQITAAATADGVSVIASTGSKSSLGFIVTSPLNKVEIIDTVTKKAIEIDSNEVYARLTESGGAYTLSYYTIVSGTETAASITSTAIDFFIAYNYENKDFPFDSALRVSKTVVGEDPASTGGKPKTERVTITGTNTLANLSFTPIDGTDVTLHVNGKTEDAKTNGAISLAGKVITWSAVNAGYDIETTDVATAQYHTLES